MPSPIHRAACVLQINQRAEIICTKNSVLKPSVLLNKARFCMDEAGEHPQWLTEAREHEHTPETIEFRISSFIFRAKRPFHPQRLNEALGVRPRPGALGALLRLKGIAWHGEMPNVQVHAALAGTQFSLSAGPPWWATLPRDQWPEELQAESDLIEQSEYGDRCTELVCIGRELDAEAARAQLEGCVMTPDEMVSTGFLRVMEEQMKKAEKKRGRAQKKQKQAKSGEKPKRSRAARKAKAAKKAAKKATKGGMAGKKKKREGEDDGPKAKRAK